MIELKSPSQIEIMRRAGRIVAEVLRVTQEALRPGITTLELDRLAEKTIRAMGGAPAFKGYHGYPATLCTSINEQVVHGIPSNRKLQEGDIIGIDAGAVVDGYYADAAITAGVGTISEEAQNLMRITQQALEKGIGMAVSQNHLSDISHTVQHVVESNGYSVVRDFVGHGIGTQLHEPPQIPNYGEPGFGPQLKKGMVLAIEPMVNQGGAAVEVLADGWTAVAKDGKLSAHFEHTVAVTENGPEILTEWPKKSPSK